MRMRLEGMYGLAGVLLAAAALEILVRADVVPARIQSRHRQANTSTH